MFLLHHQVYNPADVIWDAEDWADMTDDTPSFLSSSTEETNMNICTHCGHDASDHIGVIDCLTPEEVESRELKAKREAEADRFLEALVGLAEQEDTEMLGWQHGYDGLPDQNPHPEGTLLHQYYRRAYRAGQDV